MRVDISMALMAFGVLLCTCNAFQIRLDDPDLYNVPFRRVWRSHQDEMASVTKRPSQSKDLYRLLRTMRSDPEMQVMSHYYNNGFDEDDPARSSPIVGKFHPMLRGWRRGHGHEDWESVN